MGRRFARWWLGPVAAGAGLIGAAGWGVATAAAPPHAGAAPLLPAPVPVAIPPATARVASTPTTTVPMPVDLPDGATSLTVASLGISAPAVAVADAGGVLSVPADPADVGWWMAGPGELVLDGHVDMEGVGPGALYRLQHLAPGAAIVVAAPGGTEHWVVAGVRSYTKGQLPAALFAPTPAPRLVLVTCGGSFDAATHHYADNVVAYAGLAP